MSRSTRVNQRQAASTIEWDTRLVRSVLCYLLLCAAALSKTTFADDPMSPQVISDAFITHDGKPKLIYYVHGGSDGMIYAGVMNGQNNANGAMARYDVSDGAIERYEGDLGLSQVEGAINGESQIFFGSYARAKIFSQDPRKPWSPRLVYQVPSKLQQDRPIGLETGEGKLFIGTTCRKDVGVGLGGALTIIDATTYETLYAKRNLIPNQSPIALVYRDGILYGGTTIAGGFGKQTKAKQGEFFAFDVGKQELLWSRAIVPDAEAITSLELGSDGNVWGWAEGTLFIYDPVRDEIVYQEKKYDISYKPYTVRDVISIHVPQESAFFLTSSAKNTVYRLDEETKELSVIYEGARERSRGARFLARDPDGRLYFSDNLYGLLRIDPS